VVSVIPHFNRALKQSLEEVHPGTPFVTVMTDIADYPPHSWIERQEQHVICGSEHAVSQALRLGIPRERILKTSGMVLHPRFYESHAVDRRESRALLGLDPDRPTGLVLFGGQGSREMLTLARALNSPESGVQLILLCGRNEELAGDLRAIDKKIPMFVEEFTRDVPRYMELADFFIGKPGPACISKALAKGLPVVIQNNAWTMAHERFNARWVEEQGFGISVRSFEREISAAVKRLLEPDHYQRFLERPSASPNRAVYEIPELLQGILAGEKHEHVTFWRTDRQRATTRSGMRFFCAISPR
jgi:1,2-diacylglycerol 3-beta-galactosyltransferase